LAGDVARLLRRHRPERQAGPLPRRPDSRLRWAEAEPPAPTRLLLDTCVYIDRLKGRLGGAVDLWLERAVLRHSVVARAELALGLGFADPRHPGYAATRAQVLALLDRMPAHAVLGLDGPTLEEAGLLAGIVARRHGLAPDARRRLLNDALLVLTARAHGLTLLTRNRGDMDLIGQVAGVEAILFYRIE
jgi:predicted nucleic acid-binding protein